MQDSTYHELETLFLALGDKTRLRLLALMADGPVAVGLLADRLNESQPKVSRHLAYLRNAGIVKTRRDGKWIYYGIDYPDNLAIRRILETIIRSVAVMSVDRTDEYFSASDASGDAPKPDIYDNAYVNSSANAYQYPSADEYNESPIQKDELDIFLL